MTDQQEAALQAADECVTELWRLTWKTLTALCVSVAVVVGVGIGIKLGASAGVYTLPVKKSGTNFAGAGAPAERESINKTR